MTSRFEAIVWLLAIALPALSIARSPADNDPDRQLIRAVERVNVAKPGLAQIDAAANVEQLVATSDLSQISSRTIHAIASLLDIKNDGVRYWIAGALGRFGVRARFAAPKLLHILTLTDCLAVETSSSASIRPALESMGINPPPENCKSYHLPQL